MIRRTFRVLGVAVLYVLGVLTLYLTRGQGWIGTLIMAIVGNAMWVGIAWVAWNTLQPPEKKK